MRLLQKDVAWLDSPGGASVPFCRHTGVMSTLAGYLSGKRSPASPVKGS